MLVAGPDDDARRAGEAVGVVDRPGHVGGDVGAGVGSAEPLEQLAPEVGAQRRDCEPGRVEVGFDRPFGKARRGDDGDVSAGPQLGREQRRLGGEVQIRDQRPRRGRRAARRPLEIEAGCGQVQRFEREVAARTPRPGELEPRLAPLAARPLERDRPDRDRRARAAVDVRAVGVDSRQRPGSEPRRQLRRHDAVGDLAAAHAEASDVDAASRCGCGAVVRRRLRQRRGQVEARPLDLERAHHDHAGAQRAEVEFDVDALGGEERREAGDGRRHPLEVEHTPPETGAEVARRHRDAGCLPDRPLGAGEHGMPHAGGTQREQHGSRHQQRQQHQRRRAERNTPPPPPPRRRCRGTRVACGAFSVHYC